MTVPEDSEWRIGWRIVLACAIANGTGISLLFYCFSLFLIPMSAELNMTRAETGQVQTLIITAVLGAPVIGRLTDLFGFRTVYVTCSLLLVAISVAQGLWISGFWSLALTVGLSGFLGGGTSAVTLTQPINAHFRKFRGRALGLVGIGVSLTTILIPPLLQLVIAENWRWGFLAMAGLAGLVGLPAVLLLMPRSAGQGSHRRGQARLPQDWSFARERDFWLLSMANLFAGMATGGAISQLAPMISENGLSPAIAALGLSTFAAGQFIGKVGGGWLLDRFEPRRMAILMTIIPSIGFLMFLQADPGMALLVLLACGMIGALSGADVDIYAYFVARRFGLGRYGSVFGALHGLGWIGIAAGITLFSRSHTMTGSY
ncbi:MAG: MFS transporter, partial [Sphingomonadales bacterium]|nr:MFS transporter [Sphingomonadales bacterium]